MTRVGKGGVTGARFCVFLVFGLCLVFCLGCLVAPFSAILCLVLLPDPAEVLAVHSVFAFVFLPPFLQVVFSFCGLPP